MTYTKDPKDSNIAILSKTIVEEEKTDIKILKQEITQKELQLVYLKEKLAEIKKDLNIK